MALATAVGWLHVGSATAQTGCRLVEVGGYTLSARNTVGSYTHYASGGVDYRCDDGVRIVADSAVGFETNSTLNLYGNVRFEDQEVILEAGEAIYFGQSRYLQATHGSRVEYKNTGTVVVGEELDYYRQSDLRSMDEMTVRGGRPHATVYPQVASQASGEEALAEEMSDGDEPVGDTLAEESAGEEPVAEPLAEGPPMEEPLVEGDSADQVFDEEASTDDSPSAEPSTDQPPPDSLPPYEVYAERFVVQGRSAFRAVNEVVLVRDSLRATGDTLYYDQGSGAMSMRGEPRVGDGRFDLAAEALSITPATPGNEDILASGEAVLAGAAVAIEAPAIRLFLQDGDLGRLVALATVPVALGAVQPDTAGMTPGDQARVAELAAATAASSDSVNALDSLPRPSAYAEDLTLVADSIEVVSPNQVLEELTAVGAARAVAARADSADEEELPEVARSDWMEGDTIVAAFLPPGSRPGDASSPRAAGRSLLETLVAVGNARSLYRVPPDTTIASEEQPTGPPPLHWTQGQRITMHLADGEVVRMVVEGQTVGYHLEPLPPAALADSATAADSTTADSVANGSRTAADTLGSPAASASGPTQTAAPTPASPDASPVHPRRRRT